MAKDLRYTEYRVEVEIEFPCWANTHDRKLEALGEVAAKIRKRVDEVTTTYGRSTGEMVCGLSSFLSSHMPF
jgi:hypothetical protein